MRLRARLLPMAAAGAGLIVLGIAWGGLPMPRWLEDGFLGHMVRHLAVVAVAAPLLAAALAAVPRPDPTAFASPLFNPLVASLLELLVVWGWHAPALRLAATLSPLAYAAEQASFLAVGLLLWLSVFGGGRAPRAGAGVLGLLLTSMHMTLLGALLSLAPRPLYAIGLCLGVPGSGLSPLEDQQLGGIAMLAFGGLVYLIGGLALAGRLLRGDDGKGAAERAAATRAGA